jgi:hypothetical protein
MFPGKDGIPSCAMLCPVMLLSSSEVAKRKAFLFQSSMCNAKHFGAMK